jgi:hypothetical protein
MKQYLLSVWTREGQQPPSDEDMQQSYKRVDELNEVIRAEGAWVFAGGLHPAPTATVVTAQDSGDIITTDGPYAETKEQLGGILILEARDLNHAIQLMSKHPGVGMGPFEIRPSADLSEMIRESDKRRGARPA